MRQSLKDRASRRISAQPSDETPVFITRAIVSSFSAGGIGTTARLAMRSTAAMANASRYVILTNRRLVLLDQTYFSGPGKEVTADIPIGQFRLAEYVQSVMPVVRIAVGSEGDGVALTFGAFSRRRRQGSSKP